MSNELTILDAEIVPVISMDDAVALDREIRDRVASVNDEMLGLQELIDEAKRVDLHTPLGFLSWTAYVADVFVISNELGREQRRELVSYLAGEGMSNRAIAQAVGVSHVTVINDRKSTGQVVSDLPPDRPTITVDRTVIDSATGEVISEAAPLPPVTGLDGKTYPPRPKPQPPTEEQLIAHHETERLVADQETLNRWSRAVDALTNALSYAKTFEPPENIPPNYPSTDEFKLRLSALCGIAAKWKES